MIDILVIGAGPAGLSVAIEAQKRGLSHLILEKGSLVDSIRRFPTNMTFFSTPELLEIGGIPFICSTFRPTRVDALRYYQRVAQNYDLKFRSDADVTDIRKVDGHFRVRSIVGEFACRFVVAATGYYDDPNPYDVPGVSLPKVSRYYTEPFRYVGREVAIVGGKNSAVDAALELYRSGAFVTIIHRGPRFSDGVKYWLLPDIENRIKSDQVRCFFNTRVGRITGSSLILEGEHTGEIANDFVFVLIGYRPSTRLLENAGVRIDQDSLGPAHDPQTMETDVEGLYIAGSIAAGKYNNKIFIENGREHGKLVIHSILSK